METPNGNTIEWFFDSEQEGYGFALFIGAKTLPITDGKYYQSDNAALEARLLYEQSRSTADSQPTSDS